ncbi:hypothetical protein GEMRC1_005538 [Eukaryota sp. GEM-RC1]
MKITLKQMSKPPTEIDVDPTSTVPDFKQTVANQIGESDTTRIRLIFSGRVLKDTDTLETYNIKEGSAVHVIRSSPPQSAPPQTPAVQTPQPAVQPPPVDRNRPPTQPAPQQTPSSAFAFPGMEQMTSQMMGNPEMMQQMMNSPMMESIMSNPDMIQSMFENNPMLRQLSESNPEIAAAMRDPETLRSAMEMMRNPQRFRETMANQERTMSMMQNIPGGERVIRDAYESIEGLGATPASTRPRETSAETPSTIQQQEFPSLETPAQPQGGARGMFDPSMMGQMMDNPAMQSMMSQMAGNPEQLSQMMGNNPFLSGGGMDPSAMSSLFQNPAVMRELQNPDTISALMRLQNAMAQGGSQPSPTAQPFAGAQPQAPRSAELTVEQMMERYQVQLTQMAEMGMCATDDERKRCAQLLHRAQGNVNAAIEMYYSSL